MESRRYFGRLTTVLTIFGLLASAAPASADALFAVTIKNLTRRQVITAPLIASHNKNFALFTPGEAASPELAALAENGATMDLEMMLDTDPRVHDVAVGGGGVPPGESITIEVMVRGNRNLLSGAAMLATSNDAFLSFRGVRAPYRGKATFMVPAYDAGSEANSELCAYIPGPPCNSPGMHDPAVAEGFIHIHNGIHGIGDLNEANMDWRNPVAMITIEKIH